MTNELIDEMVYLANNLMSDWPPARNMQRKFILAYIANGFTNGSEAAKTAGYSPKTANTLASNMLTGMNKYEHIPPVVKELKNAYDDRSVELSIATGTEVLQYLTSVMRGEKTETVATAKGLYEGVELSAKDKIKAAELLGKRHALFTDKVDIAGDIGVTIVDDI
ncbi:hypothetical protein A5819_003797 [Enterococcus sp. 7E2_DIV0204]|uniref:terminase small subunit n=1 Tax=unclassified Enterococcus TaxID=2608891 RepID=UPI000B63F65A|nr:MULTISPECIES: terminase small subunit [unclassified Enterococcus]OTN83700.1 hypothetical protein A5819_003797 [Enterococcus sp. 7E2_DIV0204]OTP53083.1 hypothetical protein A5884_002286 [Enterococcus sp. 7D2_DIV0200]